MTVFHERPPIVVTRLDHRRLSRLAEATADYLPRAGRILAGELRRATLVDADAVAPTVVTMNAEFDYRDRQSGRVHRVTLVYPGQADLNDGRLSILTRIGMALFGLSEGQSIAWRRRDGQERTVAVLRVHFQPEAARRFYL